MEDATHGQGLSQARPTRTAGGWQVLWFLLHLAAVYAIATFFTTRLAGWTSGTLLPLLEKPTPLNGAEFLFSHLLVFSSVPAFAVGLVNARFKQKVAYFVWIVPAAILSYKVLTFPAPSIFHSQLSAAFHQYFGGGFLIPQFQNWHDFWSTVGSNPDMQRGIAQLNFTAPFYAGIGYSLAAWISHRTDLGHRVSEKVKSWEESRFEHRS